MFVTTKRGKTEYLTPVTPMQVELDMVSEAVEKTICAVVDGEVVDMDYVIDRDCTLELLDLADERAQVVYQHTAAHLLAQAVKALYPTAKLVESPATKDGFRCDVAFAMEPENGLLGRLVDEMKNIVEADLAIERAEMSRTAAIKIMRGYREYYKIQTIEALPKGTRVAIYKFGDFEDLTAGPHLSHTGQIVDFALKSAKRVDRVWRIEGAAFPAKVKAQPVERRGKAKTYGVRAPLVRKK